MLGIWLDDREGKLGEEKGNGNSFVPIHILGMKYDFYKCLISCGHHMRKILPFPFYR